MAANEDNLFAEKVQQDDSELVEDLYSLSKKSPKLVRSTEYGVPGGPSLAVRSWKMNEFKYYDVPSPFPTLARGLFTQDVKLPNGKKKHRIVARGYDKFFNIGEVPWTNWAWLEENTRAPYVLTLKSNGCIIFIAALTPTKLLVTSKHALGPAAQAGAESHAEVGQRWLSKHLADVGKTEEHLAAVLWEKNWTAVAELCDDSFEEHVLPYSKDKTGLHLHGLNESTRGFKTMLQDTVDAFAAEWGFIQTSSTVLETIPEVKSYTEAIGKSGKWHGEPLEGFVVRTHVSPPATGGKAHGPYAHGSSFFFKVKFDEPYMMYRDWREVTKTLLSKGTSEANLPKSKLRRPETKVYVKWVIGEIKRDRGQFSEFTKGRGIIATRERFLKWLEGQDGKKAVEGLAEGVEEGLSGGEGKTFGKTIIVPVAVPGVGKTSVAVALAHLFGFGHTQSDDVKAKKSAPVFVKNVVQLLKAHDVVIADKNNHLRQHRQQLRDAVQGYSPPVRLLALNWSFDLPLSALHRICGDRIVARGARHQSLRADAGKAHEDVLWLFLRQAEELQAGEVDASVEMDAEESLEDAVTRAADACVRILGLPPPDQEKLMAAVAAARAYAPARPLEAARGKKEAKKEKAKPPRYFAILAEVDLPGVLGARMGADDAPKDARKFWEHLRDGGRVAQRPHITLVHEKSLPDEADVWERCAALHALPTPPLLSFRLGHLVWNRRIMAATVEDLVVSGDEQGPEQNGAEFVVQLPPELRERLHVTVGTWDKSVPPVEAKDLVGDWRRGKGDGEAIELTDVWVKGRVKGLYN